MMLLCPCCGHHLPRPILDGIILCINCNRVSDTSYHNQLLSAGWIARKKNINDPEVLIDQYGYKKEDAEFVVQHVYEDGCSHEEFLTIVRRICPASESSLDLAC